MYESVHAKYLVLLCNYNNSCAVHIVFSTISLYTVMYTASKSLATLNTALGRYLSDINNKTSETNMAVVLLLFHDQNGQFSACHRRTIKLLK